MKKSLQLGFISLFLLFAFVFVTKPAMAQVVLNNSTTAFNVEQSSFSQISVRNTFTAFNTLEVNTNAGDFTEISLAHYSSTFEVGLPKLPVMRKLITIPIGATLDVSIVSYDVKEYKLSDLGINNKILPAQPPVAKNNTEVLDFVINQKAYNQDRFFGDELASTEILGIMRNTRVARLNIAPVQYNPVTGTIKVYDNLVVNVRFVGGDMEATQQLADKNRSIYFNRLNSIFANQLPLMPSREDIVQYPVKMVIVSDPMFQQTLQPYIQWKIKKGFTVIEAYTNNPAVGTTTTTIKNYLQGLYNNGTTEDPSPSFVLFVGDVAQIPAFDEGEHVTDLYYCEYTNDYFPELYYGRFSATNVSQLQAQIDKTLMYEQYLFPDPSFLGECIMVSGVDAGHAPTYGNGQINYGTTYYFNEAHGLLSHTYLYPESESASAAIIQLVSDGVGYANYTAHGSPSGWANPSFSISDIPGLQNDGQYPLMVGNCCQTSTYNIDCFGEELLRADHKGAIGYIGGSNSSYWDEDYFFGVGVGAITANPTYEGTTLGNYDRLFHDHGEVFADWYTTMDQMIFAGNLAVTEGSPSMAEYYWEIYCLMGDPSLTAYMGVPATMTVTYDPLMPLSTTEFTVNAAPHAYVAISKDGVLYGAALADENGVAVVSLDPITVPGNADIVVTCQNKQPFLGTVVVASPDGPYVIMLAQSVNDENANNNQQADYNEAFGFNMSLKNVGNTEASNLTVTISSSCPYVSIKDAIENWDNILPGDTIAKPMAFELLTNNWLPDQFTAIFNLEITNGTETWLASFNIKLNAPDLVAEGLIINDFVGGNANGRLDAGETVKLTFPISNNGHIAAPGTINYLFSDSEFITIDQTEYMLDTINCGETLFARYDAIVADSVETGTVINLFVSANADPYFTTKVYNPSIGLLTEDFETGDFSAYDWQNSSTIPWIISNTVYNGGIYGAQSGVINDNQSTNLELSINVLSNDNISFARKVSSESNYDFLKFYIDDIEKGSWSGNLNWETVSFPVTPGEHTFKWSYTKDGSQANGSDAGYIDDIVFPSFNSNGQNTEFAIHPFAYPEAVCQEQDIRLFAFTTNESGTVSYHWEPAELLSDTSVYNPIAHLTDSTVFTITAESGLSFAEAELTVGLVPVPQTPVITQQGDLLISDAAEGNQWYNSDGAIEGAVFQTFEPLVSGFYHVVITSSYGCASSPSNEIYMNVISVPTIEAGLSLNVYPNPFSNKLYIDFNMVKSSNVKISLISLLGKEVSVLYQQSGVAYGQHNLKLEPRNLKSGVYFLKFETADTTFLRKLILFE